MGSEAAMAADPLLAALVWLTRHHGNERSAASLMTGQPVDGPLAAAQALRVMQAAGFKAGVIERPLAQLDALLLPAVLLLRERGACIVRRRLDGARYEVVEPVSGAISVQDEAALGARCTGFVMLVTPGVQGPRADAGGHWLWSVLRRFVPHYRAAMLAALLSNVLMLSTGLITSVIYDKVIPHQAFVTLWALASVAAVSVAFDLTARQLRAYLIDLAGKKADLLVGTMLFKRTLNVRMEHRPESAGACAHHMGQIELVRDFIASASLSVFSDVPFVLVFMTMIFMTAGPLGWVVALAIPTILGTAALLQRSLRRTMRDNLKHQADQQSLLVEAIEGLEDLKAANAQGRFAHRHEAALLAGAETSMRARRIAALSANLSAITQQIVTLVMLVWGVHLIAENRLTGGALIGAVMYATRAIAPLTGVVSLASRYQAARAAMSTLEQLMALPGERAHVEHALPPMALSGRIALRDVGFAYPATGTAAAPQVLRGVNLRFEPGERVAIIGRIGSGKSTALRVLAGLYEPTQGLVEVDGIDLRQLDPADFRAQIGFVSQEPRLFNGTLRENVVLGRPNIDAAALAEAARLTGLDRVVESHPLGWERPVGEMGTLLSGGQRQLVALARCLVTRPRILLMDEPTSSMDAQSELAFLRHLAAAAGRCTLVMVTHRPAVLELVQRIVVIDAGQVLLDGPKPLVLAALAGQKPGPAAPTPAAGATSAAAQAPAAGS